MAATVEGGGFDFSAESVSGTWTWRVRSNNLQGVGQLYEVVDINTPFGPFVNVRMPIPGDIIQGMADSILDLQSQLAPLLSLTSASESSFILTITEGDPDLSVGVVSVQNVGAFGSFMTVTASPSVAWLNVSPSVIQNIGKNETANINISALTATLLNSKSPFSGVINIQDNRNTPTTISIPVTIVVNPRPVISAGSSQISLTYVISTNTAGVPQILTVSNSGPSGSILDFTVATLNGSTWLDVTPLTGGPLAAGESTDLTVSVIAANAPQAPGTYTDTIRISSSNASNSPLDIPVSLTVS